MKVYNSNFVAGTKTIKILEQDEKYVIVQKYINNEVASSKAKRRIRSINRNPYFYFEYYRYYLRNFEEV